MSTKGKVISVNLSEKKGTTKHPVEKITIDKHGIMDDAHSGSWHRQVSILSKEVVDAFSSELNRPVLPGEFAENITTQDLSLSDVAILDRFRIGEVELELTQIGKKCHGSSCAIYQEVGRCVMPKQGVFCRVVQGGEVKSGDSIIHIAKPFNIIIITLSDRAFLGDYQDRSGPRAQEILEQFFQDKPWHLQIKKTLLPDDSESLRKTIEKAIHDRVDVVFTLGGTGIGPRDMTPETVMSVCDKTIPGIMESIRYKFGSDRPHALLSRSIAAIARKTQIYTLPGSPRAVSEYLIEILKLLEHITLMLHGIDSH